MKTRIWRARIGLVFPIFALGVLPEACSGGEPTTYPARDDSKGGGGQMSEGGANAGATGRGGTGAMGAISGAGISAATSETTNGGAGAVGDAAAGVGGDAAAGVGGTAEGGAAGGGETTSPGAAGTPASASRILDAWPKEVASGQPLLILGENLRTATIELNGKALPPACSDGSCSDATKAVVFVPSNSSGAGLLNTRGSLPSQGVPVYVVSSGSIDSPVARPTNPFIPRFVTGYPPISDRWMNECNLYDDGYFFSQTQVAGDFTFFGGSSDPNIRGSIAASTGLIRFSMGSSDADYVGVFSATVLPYTSRIVAFPVHAGGQLVLLNCDESKADTSGSVCPSTNTGSASNFNGGPTACHP